MAQPHSEGVQQLAEAADVNYREIDVLEKEFQQVVSMFYCRFLTTWLMINHCFVFDMNTNDCIEH